MKYEIRQDAKVLYDELGNFKGFATQEGNRREPLSALARHEAGSGLYARHEVGGEFSAAGTAVHQAKRLLPMVGRPLVVRAVFETDDTATPLVVAGTAVASGRTYADLDPVNPDGTPAAFTVYPGVAGAVAPSATQTRYIHGPWMGVTLSEDPAHPGWGVVYVQAQIASGGRSRNFLNGQNGPFNVAAPYWKHQVDWQGGGHALGARFTAATRDAYFRLFHIEARLVDAEGLAPCKTFAVVGDSRSAGVGSSGQNYGWALRVAEELNAEGVRVGFENLGVGSTTSDTFLQRLRSRLEAGPLDAVLYQAASSNDANPWTEATVSMQIGNMHEARDLCRRAGVAFRPFGAYPPFNMTTEAHVAQWRRVNAAVRALGGIDFDLPALHDGAAIPKVLPGLFPDDRHGNDAAHAIMKDAAKPEVRRLLRV